MNCLRIARCVLWMAIGITACYRLLPAPAPSSAWLHHPRRTQPAVVTPDAREGVSGQCNWNHRPVSRCNCGRS
jgi:hypothetical protein